MLGSGREEPNRVPYVNDSLGKESIIVRLPDNLTMTSTRDTCLSIQLHKLHLDDLSLVREISIIRANFMRGREQTL